MLVSLSFTWYPTWLWSNLGPPVHLGLTRKHHCTTYVIYFSAHFKEKHISWFCLMKREPTILCNFYSNFWSSMKRKIIILRRLLVISSCSHYKNHFLERNQVCSVVHAQVDAPIVFLVLWIHILLEFCVAWTKNDIRTEI